MYGAYIALGNAYQSLEDFSQAIEYLTQGLAIAKPGKEMVLVSCQSYVPRQRSLEQN
jgi:tetratricopeptide (TPR) repeat protein